MKRLVLGCAVGMMLLRPWLGQTAETQNAPIAVHTKDLVVMQGEKFVPFQSKGKLLLQSKSDQDAEEILQEFKVLLKQPRAKEQ
jgi:hypothetical protein